jgi:hypothetical protein
MRIGLLIDAEYGLEDARQTQTARSRGGHVGTQRLNVFENHRCSAEESSVRELSENRRRTCPTRPKTGGTKSVKRLGLRGRGLAGVTPIGGLLISRLKVRFLHGSPFDSGGSGTPGSPDSVLATMVVTSWLVPAVHRHPLHHVGSRCRGRLVLEDRPARNSSGSPLLFTR